MKTILALSLVALLSAPSLMQGEPAQRLTVIQEQLPQLNIASLLQSKATIGSYLVIEQNKTYTFLYVHDLQNNHLILEEISIPAARFDALQMTWRQWFETGTHGNTAWNLIWIDLNNGHLEKGYSFTHQAWFDVKGADMFLSTLINLRFTEVPLSERKKIGLPPGYRHKDTRPLWSPPIVIDGQTYLNVPFSAWKARWPQDGSELSNKIIEIYVPQLSENTSLPPFPTYFPYWIEVEGKVGNAHVMVVDSGMEASSPQRGAKLLDRFITR